MSGVNFPVLCMFRYCLIREMSFCICFINDLILVWCMKDSECKNKHLLAVNNGLHCTSMVSIVSFILKIVPVI